MGKEEKAVKEKKREAKMTLQKQKEGAGKRV